jgi:hypothetical protein
VYAFANGQTEHHYPDGSQKIDFPDGTSKRIAVNGDEETQFVDGTVQHLSGLGPYCLGTRLVLMGYGSVQCRAKRSLTFQTASKRFTPRHSLNDG